MRLVQNKKFSVSMNEEELNNFNLIIAYFDDQNGEELKSYSAIVNIVFKIFIQLFLENTNVEELPKRLNQLREIQSMGNIDVTESNKYILSQNKIILNKLEQIEQSLKIENKNEDFLIGNIQSNYDGNLSLEILKNLNQLVQTAFQYESSNCPNEKRVDMNEKK